MSSNSEQPSRFIDDPILAALADDLNVVVKSEKTPSGDETPVITKVDETPATTTPPAAGGEGDPKPKEGDAAPKEGGDGKPKVSVRSRAKRDGELVDAVANAVVNKMTPPQPAPAAAAAPAAATTDTLPPDDGLSQEQKDELADAAFAEAEDPKFKGMSAKLKKFYADVDEWVDKRKDDPDRTFDQSDAEFMKFVESKKPSWGGQREKFRIERIADQRAEAKLKKAELQNSGKIDKAQRDAHEAKVAPVIEREISSFRTEVAKEMESDDPLESEIFTTYKDSAEQLASDYLRLINRVDSISDTNPPDLQQRHSWIVGFVATQAELFDKTGGDKKVRDGKTFVTPVKYHELQKANDPKLAKSWTFTKADVLTALKNHAVGLAKKHIEDEVKTAERRGFVRKPKAPAAATKPNKQEDRPTPTSGVRVGSTPAPGAAASGNGVVDPPNDGLDVISTLGL